LFNKKLKARVSELEDRVQRLYLENEKQGAAIRQLECPHPSVDFRVFHLFSKVQYEKVCKKCGKVLAYYSHEDGKIAKAIALQAEAEELLK
jgi:hypothetical protein